MKPSGNFWWASTAVLVLVCALASFAGPADDDANDEFNLRLKNLDPGDIDGHYQLAVWCKEQEAYKLLERQARYVLRLNPDHEPARLLLDLAKRKLAAAGEDGSSAAGAGGGSVRELGRVLDDDEIQILRRWELEKDPPERVSVKLRNDVLRRFFDQAAGSPGFGYDDTREDRAKFFKLPRSEQAADILLYGSEAMRQDVEIVRDPARFAVFKRKVLPVILDSCATASCHGTNGDGGWRIYSDKLQTTQLVYTNYLILHEFESGTERLINRDNPDQSLLLRYGLGVSAGGQDAGSEHPVKIDPAFKDARDRRYIEMRDWLHSLDVVKPDYGISLGSQPEKK